jgi:hypothetical protein
VHQQARVGTSDLDAVLLDRNEGEDALDEGLKTLAVRLAGQLDAGDYPWR